MQAGWLRKVLAVGGGVLLAGLCIASIEGLAHRVTAGEPVFAAALSALFAGALLGGGFAVGLTRSALCGWIVVAALGLLSAANVASFPHPAWYVPAAAVVLLTGGWLATRFSARARTAQ